MNRLHSSIFGFTGAASRLGGVGVQILQDRLELFALEMREAKIRFVQALILVCFGVVFSLLGLLLLVLAGVYALPLEWRLFGLAVAAVASLLVGVSAFLGLLRVLGRKPLAFDQSLSELKKDTACFLTKN